MKHLPAILACLVLFASPAFAADDEAGFISLFDGTMNGWKISGPASSFSIEDGAIKANGPCAHLFYDGDVEDHDFTNFHYKADVLTKPNANGGLYFHTKFQESGWPRQGYEAQVNKSHRDPKRTGSLYAVVNVADPPCEDNEWYTQEIIVKGKHIVIKVNGKVVVDYTEPETFERDKGWEGRRLSSGTFAIQAHDPGSVVYVKNIRVKPLND